MLVLGGLAVNHGTTVSPLIPLAGVLGAVAGLFVLAGATPAALGLLADISERFPSDRGAIMGLYGVFLAIGQISGALIGGFAADLARHRRAARGDHRAAPGGAAPARAAPAA